MSDRSRHGLGRLRQSLQPRRVRDNPILLRENDERAQQQSRSMTTLRRQTSMRRDGRSSQRCCARGRAGR